MFAPVMISRVLLLILAAFVLVGCGDSKRKEAERFIQKIEAFKTKEGRLPSSLDEIGESSEKVFFQAADGEYKVWYGEDLGSSRIYRSRSKSWSSEG